MNMDVGSMLPYFHFTKSGDIGQAILFQGWIPNTPGTTFGACLGIFIFALFDRWFNGMRGAFEKCSGVRQRIHTKLSEPIEPESQQSSSSFFKMPSFSDNDIPRALIQAVQTTTLLATMLIFMTLNVAFIISAVVGLVVGHMMFDGMDVGLILVDE